MKRFSKAHVLGLAVFSAVFTSGLLDVRPGRAGIVYTIAPSGPDVNLTLTGSFAALPLSTGTESFDGNGIYPALGGIGSIPSAMSTELTLYPLTGPTTFGPGSFTMADLDSLLPTSSNTLLYGLVSRFGLASSYALNAPITASMTFSGQSISSLGLTPGTYEWFLKETNETIQLSIVPGPLPLLGAGLAYGFSRRLRRRVQLVSALPKR
jgi:hypothetical protein